MTSEQVAYYAFLMGCAIMALVPLIATWGSFQAWQNYKQVDPATVRVNRGIFAAVLVATLVLVPLGAVGFWHVVHLTPTEFILEFQELTRPHPIL